MELKIYEVYWDKFNKVKNKRHNSVIYAMIIGMILDIKQHIALFYLMKIRN